MSARYVSSVPDAAPQPDDLITGMLEQHPFFEEFDGRYLPLIKTCSSLVRFDTGETIFCAGEEAHSFYLIHEGRVVVEATKSGAESLVLQTIGTGDALGWSWLFPPYRRHFGARAVAPSELIAIRAGDLLMHAKEYPEFGYELVLRVAGVLSQRLRATRLQLAAISVSKGMAADGGDLPP